MAFTYAIKYFPAIKLAADTLDRKNPLIDTAIKHAARVSRLEAKKAVNPLPPWGQKLPKLKIIGGS